MATVGRRWVGWTTISTSKRGCALAIGECGFQARPLHPCTIVQDVYECAENSLEGARRVRWCWHNMYVRCWSCCRAGRPVLVLMLLYGVFDGKHVRPSFAVLTVLERCSIPTGELARIWLYLEKLELRRRVEA